VTSKGATRVDQRTKTARAVGGEARAELLSAALGVFARRGYREASVDEIAAAAGYSKGAVYWHFAGKAELLITLLEERVDGPMREKVALLASAPAEQDMSVEASKTFARLGAEEREALMLEREYAALALRDPELGARYVARQSELRRNLGTAMEARARHLGTPGLGMPAEDVARIVMAIIAGLSADELIEPGAVRPELLGEALAIIYAGLVARAAA
jgi:AcrR family transcriptional regulator